MGIHRARRHAVSAQNGRKIPVLIHGNRLRDDRGNFIGT